MGSLIIFLFYSAFMIGDGKLLTNAHCVEHDTQVLISMACYPKAYI